MIRLPTFTFLNGPNGSGKTTLATALCEQDSGLCHCSFAEPIRLALTATFHPHAMFDGSLDLRDEVIKASPIRGTNRTHRDWMIEFGKWMKGYFNPYIFADLARQNCDRLSPHWPRFVFDDCRFPEEPSPFSLAYGSDSCLVISIDRDGCSWTGSAEVGQSLIRLPGVSHVALSNNRSIPDALATLETVLGHQTKAHPHVDAHA